MAEPLKNSFNRKLISKFAIEIKNVHTAFDIEKFVSSVIDKDWEARELKDRMRHLTISMNQYINLGYAKSVDILTKIAPHFGGFEAMVFPDFVEVYGLDYEDISLNALEELTKYGCTPKVWEVKIWI